MTHSYMPYACMWTGALLKEKVPSKPRLSNGTVEGFFDFAKTSLFRELLPMPISHIGLGMMSYVNRVCKVCNLSINPLRGFMLKWPRARSKL